MVQILTTIMKAIIFAGGVGTRLWPLSRRNSPKQFEKVIGERSTLQLAVARLVSDFNLKDLYISTNRRYVSQVREQLPEIPAENIFSEPESRDVGPAVGLAVAQLYKKYPHTPMVILWSDHVIKKVDLFKKILTLCAQIISKDTKKIIFISQKGRFASQNLGWIRYGDELFHRQGVSFYRFESFHYRPTLLEAKDFLKSGQYAWNIGYFVTTPAYLWSLYRRFQPQIFEGLDKIAKTIGTSVFDKTLDKIYPTFPKISFDNAILENIQSDDGMVVSQDLGWSDVGAWEALKEALQTSADKNVVQGKVMVEDSRDSLIYNYTDQLVVTIDLKGLLVVNTHDVVLICHKDSVPKIKKLVERLSKSENEHLV